MRSINMPVMVFHAPFELQENPTAASALRPVRMLKAFENIGYKVWKVTGTGKERKKSLRALGRAIRGGLKVEFVYSESATIPNAFTEPRHFPLRPFLDAEFFALMHRHNIPIGVFYRDIYWVFDEYKERVGAAVAAAMSTLYRWDLAIYDRYVDVLFVPSLPMADHIPHKLDPIIVALPPGADTRADGVEQSLTGPLKLLYVGGTNPRHYEISILLEAVSRVSNVSLTICTPKDSWEKDKTMYADLLSDSVCIVHRDADHLDDLYEDADIAMLHVEPKLYWEFAMPVKLFEYIGRGKPIIATEGTMAAEVVENLDIGWSVPHSVQSLAELLDEMGTHREMIARASQRVLAHSREHTWEARARQVAAVLQKTERYS
ncbi:glycosyltransferase family 4 protein [Actinomycetaceae bacterium WB03_NA08]|uniref:Glycosyltransferase family 4 protein n=1 Tax=Scrofimicrobium canadense TaxID=2652290 RepID=A0A6N7W4L7_9ACTO|nr:glycosyltransferase [Scrofimicrobium canadense]MSS83463.1 glycosyltransferase family 4 protein [Scrofimicrobium canadense]